MTTDVTPFYNSVAFSLRLPDANKVQFDNSYTIFSLMDSQPCMERDRSSGEDVGSQQYTLIRLHVFKSNPAKLKSLEADSRAVFLLALTLRPMNVYGQTSYYLHVDIIYSTSYAGGAKENGIIAPTACFELTNDLSKSPLELDDIEITTTDQPGIDAKIIEAASVRNSFRGRTTRKKECSSSHKPSSQFMVLCVVLSMLTLAHAQPGGVSGTTNLTTVLEFENDGYRYFVSNGKRPYLPGMVGGGLPKTAPHKSTVYLTRIGNNDGTTKPQYDIDLPLACGEYNEDLEESTVLAALYDPQKKRIRVKIEKSDANGVSIEPEFCWFQLADLQQDIKNTLNICQNTTRELLSDCKYLGDGVDSESSNPHCHVFACRDGSHISYTSCSGCNSLPPSESMQGIDDLSKTNTTSIPRLVQFKPSVGVKFDGQASEDWSAFSVEYNNGSRIPVSLPEKANSSTTTVSEPLGSTSQSTTAANGQAVYRDNTRVSIKQQEDRQWVWTLIIVICVLVVSVIGVIVVCMQVGLCAVQYDRRRRNVKEQNASQTHPAPLPVAPNGSGDSRGNTNYSMMTKSSICDELAAERSKPTYEQLPLLDDHTQFRTAQDVPPSDAKLERDSDQAERGFVGYGNGDLRGCIPSGGLEGVGSPLSTLV
uniref:Uncharacterized protein n=1 Tax=Plectus sambesii TaxID=2011161 RepID=A0A914V3N7_9BILA